MRRALDDLYLRFNRREYVHPDPLEFLYAYDNVDDREVVGLIASALAYGRVAQILTSIEKVLDVLGPNPASFVRGSTDRGLRRSLAGFKHRFSTGEDVATLLGGVRSAVAEHGSLNACFLAGLVHGEEDVTGAMGRFSSEVAALAPGSCGFILPSTEGGSACKRLNLYLRWMVREDEVDPGGWTGVDPALLVVPLDTHMHRSALALGLTTRRQADLRTAVEITRGLREIAPLDPVRYDFSLTRLGIREGLSLDEFIDGIEKTQG